MSAQEPMPNGLTRMSRHRRRCQPTLPSAHALSQKLSLRVIADNQSLRSSPKKKKIRSQTPSDILRELAADAIQEMREQGFLDQLEYDSKCDDIASSHSHLGDKYDWLIDNSSQVTIADCDEPQSPRSFFDRIGLERATRPKPMRSRTLPPELPQIFDEQSKSTAESSMSPSECSTPESALNRRKPLTSIGNVTPATAEVAQYLLRLRG